MDSTFLE